MNETARNSKQILQMIQQNLEYIEKSILNDTYREQAGIIQFLLSDVILEVKNFDFSYTASYSAENNKYHFYVYIMRGEQAKAKTLASLEDIRTELARRKGKPQVALRLIQRLLKTNLHKEDVQKVINKWVNTNNQKVKVERIYVK